MTDQETVKLIKDYALAHYEESEWSEVIECFEDEEILEQVGDARGEAALDQMKWYIGLRDEQARTIRSEIF